MATFLNNLVMAQQGISRCSCTMDALREGCKVKKSSDADNLQVSKVQRNDENLLRSTGQ